MAQLGTFDIGDKPVITATFRNTAEVLTDPTTVVFLWQTPDYVEATYTYGVAAEVTRTSLGVFAFAPPTITRAGAHHCRAKGTTGLIAAGEGSVTIRPSAFVIA